MAIVDDVDYGSYKCPHCDGTIQVVVQVYQDGGLGAATLSHLEHGHEHEYAITLEHVEDSND
jgi:uncharacterized protein (UPF0212 family)